jgi:hypothetical protein
LLISIYVSTCRHSPEQQHRLYAYKFTINLKRVYFDLLISRLYSAKDFSSPYIGILSPWNISFQVPTVYPILHDISAGRRVCPSTFYAHHRWSHRICILLTWNWTGQGCHLMRNEGRGLDHLSNRSNYRSVWYYLTSNSNYIFLRFSIKQHRCFKYLLNAIRSQDRNIVTCKWNWGRELFVFQLFTWTRAPFVAWCAFKLWPSAKFYGSYCPESPATASADIALCIRYVNKLIVNVKHSEIKWKHAIVEVSCLEIFLSKYLEVNICTADYGK